MHRTSQFAVGTQKCICHSLKEWVNHKKLQDKMIQDGLVQAEKIIEQSDRIRDRTKESVERKKTKSEWRISERIEEIEFVRAELEKARKLVQDELEALVMLEKRIQNELEYITKNALEIIEKCIRLREERREIDKVHDEVKKELEKERRMIIDCENILEKALEQTKETKRILRASLYFLNKDVEGKLKCLVIETECLNMKETDLDIDIYRGNEVLDKGNITLQEWARYSEEIIKSTKKKIQEARLLQPHFRNILGDIMCDLKIQLLAVNDAFQMRISEIKEAKVRFEKQHYEISRQVNNMSVNIAELKKSIQEKRGYLALAQSRLEKRSRRPFAELVRDEVEACLVKEILEISNSVSQLQKMLSEAEMNLRYLLKAQVKLEEEINIKTNSIKIDEVDCLTLRQGISYQPF